MTFNTVRHITTPKALIELHEMLTYPRYADTYWEKQFIAKFIDTLPNVSRDEYGNRHVKIGDVGVMWSSHTDSVHSMKDKRQVVLKRDGFFALKDPKASSCLGADCATGVWIMRHMILRGIPGHYIFHREEEVGGLGSEWIARPENRHMIEHAQAAIAFDRKGYDSVITHQGGRTASDAFAKSLANQLGGKYKPDPTGLFTDTKKYAGIIPECTNLSVGYHSAHSGDEKQDVQFAADLLDCMCAFDPTDLVIERDPTVIETYAPAYQPSRWTDHYDSAAYDWGWDDLMQHPAQRNYAAAPAKPVGRRYVDNYGKLLELVREHPHEIADWLDQQGIDADELFDELNSWR